MIEFKYKAYIPSIDDYVLLKELKTEQYIALVKTVMNKQQDMIVDIFDQLIDHSSDRKINLTRLDKFFILCTIRAVCVGGRLTLAFEDTDSNKPYKSHVQIMNLLQHVADVETPDTQVIELNDITITLGYPRSLYVDSPEHLLYECIQQLAIADHEVNINSLTLNQKKDLVDQLPVELLEHVKSYIMSKNKMYSDVILYRVMNPHATDQKIQTQYFNIFDNSMYDFIVTLFSDNIKSIYELMYVLSKRVRMSVSDLYNNTYAEVRMYLDTYEQELKMEEEARKKEQQKRSGSSGGPAPIGNPIMGLPE